MLHDNPKSLQTITEELATIGKVEQAIKRLANSTQSLKKA